MRWAETMHGLAPAAWITGDVACQLVGVVCQWGSGLGIQTAHGCVVVGVDVGIRVGVGADTCFRDMNRRVSVSASPCC